MMDYISVDHLPDDHLRGIGLVAVSWAYLEGTVERLIWSLNRLDSKRGECTTTHLTVRSRFDIATSLAHEELEQTDIPNRLKLYATYVTNDLARQRNKIVHSRLHYDPNWQNPVRGTYKARGKRQKQIDRAEISEYELASREIINTANVLIGILKEINILLYERDGTLPPWLDSHGRPA